MARVAAASIDRDLRSAGSRLVVFSSGPTFRAALRDRDSSALDARLADLLADTANTLGAVLDPAGIVLAAPLARDLVGRDFSQRDYFQGAIRSSGPYVSEIFASASAGGPSVVGVSLAVRDQGTTLGVVVLTLAPDDMLDLLRPLRQVEGRELLVLDSSGRVVASTDPAFRPLATVPRFEPSRTSPVVLAGRERIVTMGSVGAARWDLYVVDEPSVVLQAQRDLLSELRRGGAGIGVIALAAAAAVVLLYGKTVRQRNDLAASRAALADTNSALEHASRHKSEFLASMSHELRTPLNAILGFSDLLQEQLGPSLTERQKRYLRNVRDAGDHLLALINDVLDLAKVEAGRVDLRPEIISVSALLDPVIASASSAAGARGIEFEVRYAERLVLVDPGRLRQILYNLLSNAVKFTGPGGSVELGVAGDGSELVIEVADTGIGIPAGKRDRVFGTFERLHEGRSDATGTGLGLALTKELVELHGGTIEFQSEEGSGTTFRVRLPNAVAAGDETEDRVLVVEDDQRDAELIAALVAKAGLRSEIVRSVAASLAALDRARPTAIVLDLRLPDGRGEIVLERLKSEPATRNIPVVVVTVEDDDRRSRILGADDHLTKPIDHARLDGWLRQIAARAGREEAAPASVAG